MIAIYDKTTNIVTFRPAPLIDIAPISKRLKLESNGAKMEDNVNRFTTNQFFYIEELYLRVSDSFSIMLRN